MTRNAVCLVSQYPHAKPALGSIFISLLLIHFLLFSSLLLILYPIKVSQLPSHFPVLWTLENRHYLLHKVLNKICLHPLNFLLESFLTQGAEGRSLLPRPLLLLFLHLHLCFMFFPSFFFFLILAKHPVPTKEHTVFSTVSVCTVSTWGITMCDVHGSLVSDQNLHGAGTQEMAVEL